VPNGHLWFSIFSLAPSNYVGDRGYVYEFRDRLCSLRSKLSQFHQLAYYINESFRRARKNLKNNNDQEIDLFVFEKFLRWIGKVKVLLNDINLRDIYRFEKSE
jgi:hypothetical protein